MINAGFFFLSPAPLRACSRIMTLEHHLADGGFGSWLLEACDRGEADREGRLHPTYTWRGC
jgi:hypothetical protein